VEAEWLRPIAVTGEIDYTWSTHPITFGFDPDAGGAGVLQATHSHVRSCFFDAGIEYRPIGALSIPGTHETTGVYGPGLYYIGRLGPVTFELGAVAAIPINRASGRHVGALAILDFFLDDTLPDSLGKPLFGPRQPRVGGLY
jgi:hypothetical protein